MIDRAPPASLIVPRIVLDLPDTGETARVFAPDETPIERHLAADLSIAYAFDQPKCFVMVTRRDLVRLHLEEQSVHGIAVRNLGERVQRLEPEFQELSNGVFVLAGAGDFTAATLLLDDVWQQAADRVREALLVRGALVAAVPARDMLAFTCAENRQGLAFMRSRVSEVLEEGDHTLTRHFLVRRDGIWSRYEGHAG
jgi:uncharacterized protein YtpQ (UPF0354 family)